MQIEPVEVVRTVAALVAGVVIGVSFGLIQAAALRRNQERQGTGTLGNGWTVMPGSMRRVAYLLLALVLVQVICPLLFTGSTPWWVSGGVVVGYGVVLYRQLRQRLARSL